jgi:cytochrome c-type biogenesis protein CcmH
MAATDAAAAVAETPATLPSASIPEDAQINAMVDGLEARLRSQGGTIGEWTELVRSRMVQGRMKDAQDDFDAARKAFPDPKVRTELNVLAADNGLVAR